MKNTNLILAHTSNRQYPLPEKKWKYSQEWHNILFFHWRVPKSLLEKYIPEGMELDMIDNTAWVSLVAFEVKNMRLRNLPPFPGISNFHEINLRTYVVKDGIPGIYLFSIETDKFREVLLTRIFTGLPYQKSQIKRTLHCLKSDNKKSDSHFTMVDSSKASTIEKSALDLWLTERHSLYKNFNEETYRYDIHHKELNLREPKAEILDINYKAGKYAPTVHPDKVHSARRLDTLFWAKQKA